MQRHNGKHALLLFLVLAMYMCKEGGFRVRSHTILCVCVCVPVEEARKPHEENENYGHIEPNVSKHTHTEMLKGIHALLIFLVLAFCARREG